MTSLHELRRALSECDGVKQARVKSPPFGSEPYVAAEVQLAGLDLHTLHDEHDFEVRSAWHDPTTNTLRYALWPIEPK